MMIKIIDNAHSMDLRYSSYFNLFRKRSIRSMGSRLISIFLAGFFPFGLPAIGQALGPPFFGLRDVANRSTIAIKTPSGAGSGVIIGRKGNKYLFVTAKHVVAGYEPSELSVYAVGSSSSNSAVGSIDLPRQLASIDIAFGTFESNVEYSPILILALDDQGLVPGPPSPNLQYYTSVLLGSFNGRTVDKEWKIQGSPLVVGVSLPTESITKSVPRYISVEMQDRVRGNRDGYEAVYAAASTVPGMSGGGVYAAVLCDEKIPALVSDRGNPGAYGGLLAIHGRSEAYRGSGSRSGTSLGVPMDLAIPYIRQNAKKYGIPIGGSYYDKVLKVCGSVDTFFD